MIEKINCINFEHEVRHIYFDQEHTQISVCLGAGTYLVDASLETGSRRANVLIGRYCSLGHRISFIIGLNHDYHQVTTYPFLDLHSSNQGEGKDILNHYENVNHNQIIIGNDVWIGCDVTILGGVKIGNGAVIGAGAVISKDVPPYAVVVGNPARVVKYRFSREVIHKLQHIKWWNWSADIIEARWREFENVERFLDKYYNAHFKCANVSEVYTCLSGLQQSGYEIFYLPSDINEIDSVTKRVIRAYLQSYIANDKTILLLAITSDQLKTVEYRDIQKMIKKAGNNAPNIMSYKVNDLVEALSGIKTVISHLIVGKNDFYSRCIDCLTDVNVDIRYSLDISCFSSKG